MAGKAKKTTSVKRGVTTRKPSAQAKVPAPSRPQARKQAPAPPPSPPAKKPRPPVRIDSAEAMARPLKQKGVQAKPGEVHCSFCGGSNSERAILIAAQLNPVYICDDCVEICRDIIGIQRSGPAEDPEFNPAVDL